MKEIVLPLVIAILGSSSFSALVSYWLNKKAAKKEISNQLALGMQVLLEDRIDYVATHYIKNGQIGAKDKDRLQRMWRVYHEVLGGNGYLDQKMQALENLPTDYSN